MREYTIYPGNKDIILEYIRSNKINTETVANPILKPVLSKGSHSIIQLEEFIEKLNGMDNRRAVLISQYIILNQVFGVLTMTMVFLYRQKLTKWLKTIYLRIVKRGNK